MNADPKKRQVTLEQLNVLLDFLKEHQELAKGLARGRRGKLHTLKLWNMCAKQLNSCNDGAVKDGKGWSKYWCDWKYRVKRRALEIKAAKDSNRPPLEGVISLSPMEEKILSIIGENAVEGVVIKCDPLEEEASSDNVDQENLIDTKSVKFSERRYTRSRKRRHSSRDASDFIDVDEGGPSSPPERKPRASANDEEDSDNDEAERFLELERQKLESSRRLNDSLTNIATEIRRLTDVITNIRDLLMNRLN